MKRVKKIEMMTLYKVDTAAKLIPTVDGPVTYYDLLTREAKRLKRLGRKVELVAKGLSHTRRDKIDVCSLKVNRLAGSDV
jgi:hypothetical protein